ncbi:MAG: transglutaminase family protein [Sporocytophaga sp.]|uniref:transglutaminase-like domain-containing protein n=1 Tax=Sporocytophaga sp. TaxID=2231183 RepID=UPI001B12DFB6|nr:transglutaminase family protein [Sporocytophaga sp.]MBO9701455.1 transglutaminase family protein [Sporocytophaga sp.]
MSAYFDILYQSISEYEYPVKEAFFEFIISPCECDSQSLVEFNIKTSTGPDVFTTKNSLGFNQIRIRPAGYFKTFKLEYSAKVRKEELNNIDNLRPSAHEQWAEINSTNFYIENFLYLHTSPLTVIPKENQNEVLIYRRSSDLLEYSLELNTHIHNLLSYEKEVTDVSTTAADVILLKKGVCQDYTHLFLAMARSNGLACRYVSGYLDQGSSYTGTGGMHAWAEVYIPGMGWTGFDPTNNCRVNIQYIKVAHGRDYNDCSPIKGVLLSLGENKTYHLVQVSQQQQ